jgi:hypothetical protein
MFNSCSVLSAVFICSKISSSYTIGNQKIIIDNCKDEEIWEQLQSQFNCLGLEVKKENNLEHYFYPFRFWGCKRG